MAVRMDGSKMEAMLEDTNAATTATTTTTMTVSQDGRFALQPRSVRRSRQ